MNFVSRKDWGARAPKHTTPIGVIKGAAAHWEGPDMPDVSHELCANQVRSIQNFHMDSRGWDDIAYNAVYCRHGYVFEGRGFGIRSAAQGTNVGNEHYEAICFLGGINDMFTVEAKQAFIDARNWLQALPETHPHSDFHATSCPGDEIRAWIAAGLPVDGSPSAPPPTQPAPPSQQPKPAPPPVDPNKVVVDGNFGPATIKSLQRALNADGANPILSVDGDFGPATKKMLQARLNHTNGPVKIDGDIGPLTIKALQRHVGLSEHQVDGIWGKITTSNMQLRLNAGSF